MKKTYTLYAFLLAAALSGCAHPRVIYSTVAGPDEDGTIKFKFARSMLVTSAQVDRDNNFTGYTIQSVPVTSSADPKYSMVGAPWYRNWGVGTILNATYQDGSSDLLKEVGVSVKDDRVTAITDLGSIVGAIFGIAAEGAAKKAPPHLPEPVDVSLFLAKTTQPKFCESDDNNGDLLCQSDPDQYGWSMTIRINPLPDDKMTASSILKSPYLSNAYLYSACRNAQVKLFYSPDRTKKNLKDTVMIGSDSITLPTTTVQVADSNYLEALAFPTNGKVVARPSCGAESTASDSKTSNAFDIINALATSAKTAKDAKDGKTPPNSKSQ